MRLKLLLLMALITISSVAAVDLLPLCTTPVNQGDPVTCNIGFAGEPDPLSQVVFTIEHPNFLEIATVDNFPANFNGVFNQQTKQVSITTPELGQAPEIVATVTFTSVGSGTDLISLTNLDILDHDFNPLNYNGESDQVTVNAADATNGPCNEEGARLSIGGSFHECYDVNGQLQWRILLLQPCQADGECIPNAACQDNQCKGLEGTLCGGDASLCAQDHTCPENFCIGPPDVNIEVGGLGQPCDNGECNEGICINDICEAADINVELGNIGDPCVEVACNEGFCVDEICQDVECVADNDCQNGQECVNNDCQRKMDEQVNDQNNAGDGGGNGGGNPPADSPPEDSKPKGGPEIVKPTIEEPVTIEDNQEVHVEPADDPDAPTTDVSSHQNSPQTSQRSQLPIYLVGAGAIAGVGYAALKGKKRKKHARKKK